MQKTLKIFGIIVVVIILTGLVMVENFVYRNMHWWKQGLKRIKRAGAEEKQVTLSNGNVINYGETDGDAPALLLIHGQMGAWEDYACVLPEFAKKWHVYAIDVYGHRESSHDERLYYVDKNLLPSQVYNRHFPFCCKLRFCIWRTFLRFIMESWDQTGKYTV
jgi:hypothetical protein